VVQVAVRLATQDDLESVLSLYYGFYRELRGRQGWPLRGIEEYRRDVERFLERGLVFLAFLEGRAVGFACLSEREGAYWLEELYVAPEYRGLGIGRRLVEEAEEYVRGRAPALYVMVLPQDGAAIRFWIHMGYRILNTVELAKDLEEPEGRRRGCWSSSATLSAYGGGGGRSTMMWRGSTWRRLRSSTGSAARASCT